MNYQANWESLVLTQLTFAFGLRSGNRKGTIACWEKAQGGETIVSSDGQSKTRMVRAKLPKLQPGDLASIAANQWLKCCSALARRVIVSPLSKGTNVSSQRLYTQSTQPAFNKEDNRRTKCLSVLPLFSHVNAGSPKLEAMLPIRRRSCHISQMLGVMPKTVALGWMTQSINDLATDHESLWGQVKGSIVWESNLQYRRCADAA